jgi:hypothetical protein
MAVVRRKLGRRGRRRRGRGRRKRRRKYLKNSKSVVNWLSRSHDH